MSEVELFYEVCSFIRIQTARIDHNMYDLSIELLIRIKKKKLCNGDHTCFDESIYFLIDIPLGSKRTTSYLKQYVTHRVVDFDQ